MTQLLRESFGNCKGCLETFKRLFPFPVPELCNLIPTCPAVSQSWSLTGRPSTDTTAWEKEKKKKSKMIIRTSFTLSADWQFLLWVLLVN